jgi:hypothetical protein
VEFKTARWLAWTAAFLVFVSGVAAGSQLSALAIAGKTPITSMIAVMIMGR